MRASSPSSRASPQLHVRCACLNRQTSRPGNARLDILADLLLLVQASISTPSVLMLQALCVRVREQSIAELPTLAAASPRSISLPLSSGARFLLRSAAHASPEDRRRPWPSGQFASPVLPTGPSWEGRDDLSTIRPLATEQASRDSLQPRGKRKSAGCALAPPRLAHAERGRQSICVCKPSCITSCHLKPQLRYWAIRKSSAGHSQKDPACCLWCLIHVRCGWRIPILDARHRRGNGHVEVCSPWLMRPRPRPFAP